MSDLICCMSFDTGVMFLCWLVDIVLLIVTIALCNDGASTIKADFVTNSTYGGDWDAHATSTIDAASGLLIYAVVTSLGTAIFFPIARKLAATLSSGSSSLVHTKGKSGSRWTSLSLKDGAVLFTILVMSIGYLGTALSVGLIGSAHRDTELTLEPKSTATLTTTELSDKLRTAWWLAFISCWIKILKLMIGHTWAVWRTKCNQSHAEMELQEASA